MNDKEKILKYSWGEFLKTPFSLLFFTLCILVCYLVYREQQNSAEEKNSYKTELEECNDGRLKDKEVYINLLQNLKINQELKKDSVR